MTVPPTAPPARVCGSKSILDGPSAAPKGAIIVPAGDNSDVAFHQPGTTYWFAPGVHTLGTGKYDNINPAPGDTFIGAPGAILDGQHVNDSAFDDSAPHVTIEYLTIRNFGIWGDDDGQGAVNHDSGAYWNVSHSTVAGNAGAGVMLGSHDTLTWDCLEDNQHRASTRPANPAPRTSWGTWSCTTYATRGARRLRTRPTASPPRS
jgi:hypothetical protein